MEDKAEPIRVLLVDDHEVVRIGLRTLIESRNGIEVVGEAGDCAGAIAEAARLEPDVVLLDVRLPDGSGVTACREIRAARPATRVLFLTSYTDDEAALAAAFGDAQGYLFKQIDGEGLIGAICAVAAGQSVSDSQVIRSAVERMRSASTGSAGARLSAQERRVLALVAEGKTNKEIGAALKLSDKTVKNYLRRIFEKLHVTRRAQAAARFVRGSAD
jgi:DNA-binding NarL/FixJ family response regulator